MMIRKEDERRRVLYCPDKNRFGSITEKAYFEMSETGLVEILEESGATLPA
jgi:predicted ATP-dependent serine protease